MYEHLAKKYGVAKAVQFTAPNNPLTAAGSKVGITFNPVLSADPLKKHERRLARRVQNDSLVADGVELPQPKKGKRKRR